MSSQVSPSVSQKPPVLPEGVNALWAWLWAALTISDNALLNSAGLDAWVTQDLELEKIHMLYLFALRLLCLVKYNTT